MTSGGTLGPIQTADWFRNVPEVGDLHQEPGLAFQWLQPDQGGLNSMRGRLVDMVLEVVVNALQGFISPIESLHDQLINFFSQIPIIGPLVEALTGIIGGGLETLAHWTENIPFIGDLVHAITQFGDPDETVDLSFLGNWFDDLLGIFGRPSGLGSGNPIIGILENIPILGPAIGGITNAVTGIFGGGLGELTSWADNIPIIGDLIGAITGIFTGGSGGLSFLSDWFGDLLGIFGHPSGLGSGSPGVGALANIPILGPLLSGGGFLTILSSLIPGLDASKIISGSFPQNMITNLVDDLGNIIQSIIQALTGRVGGILGDLTDWAQGLLGFRNAHSGVPNIGSGQVNNRPQNLLIDGIFGSRNSFVAGNGWNYGALGGGVRGPLGAVGAAVATITTGIQSLIGNGIAVITGQRLNVRTQTQWNGLTQNATLTRHPISANLNLYDANNNLLSSTALAGAGGGGGGGALLRAGAGVSTFSLDLVPDSGDPDDLASWQELSGTLIVPDLIDGVEPVKAALQFTVSDEVDSGEARFTAAVVEKTSKMPQSAVKDLPEDQQAMKNSVAGKTAATLPDIESRLASLDPDTGEVAWEYTPKVRSLNDEIVKKFNGIEGSEFDVPDAADAIESQKSAIVSNTSAVARLASEISGLRSDVAALSAPPRTDVYLRDMFERTSATSLGSDWVQTYSGPGAHLLATDGHNAAGVTVGTGARYCLATWNGAVSATDNQLVMQVLATVPTTTATAHGYNDLIGRYKDANNFLRFRMVRKASWYLTIVQSGVETVLATGPLTVQPTSMTLAIGDDTLGADYLAVWLDSVLLSGANYPTVDIGSAYRGMGLGYGWEYDSVANTVVQGGLVNTWVGRDYRGEYI